MKERLQKLLSGRGVCSRRRAEEWILQSRVTVNGAVAVLGDQADPEVDTVLVDGAPLPTAGAPVYIMLHKPRGFVTTLCDEKGRANVTELVDCGTRVYPVGRLDMDSEGLLLLTNDGAMADRIMHPRTEVDKVYEVWVVGFVPGREKLLARRVELDGYRISQPKVEVCSVKGTQARLLVTIHEGRNRQVRRMCDAAGLKVTRLRRIREGALCLGDLPKGAWRYLTEEEIRSLGK